MSAGCLARLLQSAVPRGDRLGERTRPCGKVGSVDKGGLMLKQLDELVYSLMNVKLEDFGCSSCRKVWDEKELMVVTSWF